MKCNILTILILLAFSSFSANAQQTQVPAPGKPKDFKLPEKVVQQLGNGLKVTMVDYGFIPKVTISLIIKTGSVHEGADQVGLVNLTGKLLQEGTQSMDSKTLSKKIASMGGNLNVSTGANQITISGSVLSEFAPEFIAILADLVVNPAFPESQLARLKNDYKRQIAVQKTVPQSQAVEKFRSILYKDHPYGRVLPSEEMVDKLTMSDIIAFYDSNVGAQRASLFLVGKYNESAVKTAVKSGFEKWKKGPEVNYPIAKPIPSPEIQIIDRAKAPQTTLMIGLPVVDPSNKDYLALQLTNRLLGGSFGSRITRNIREEKGYTYSPYSSISSNFRSALWFEQADVTAEFTGASIQEIAKEIKLLQSTPPSEEETKGIQNFEAGIFVLQNSSPSGIISQLNFIDLHGLDESYLTDRVKNIYNVTPEKMQQVAKEYLKYEDMTFVLVGDKKQIEKQMEEHKRTVPSR